MRTKCFLLTLWSVLLLGLLSSAGKTHESQISGRRKVFNPDSSKSKATRGRGSRTSSRSSPRPGPRIQPDSAHPPDVSVSCSASDFVVRVRPAFYGLGAEAEELRLGRGCRSNGVLGPSGDLLFTYPLTSCDGVRELARGYLVYKFTLHYEPSPRRFPSRAHRLSVDIECHYPRDHHVHQLAVQPTWETAVVRKKLKGGRTDFDITLMDDSWTSPAKSRVYQLGDTINVQVSAPGLLPGGKLYISSCFATPSAGSKSSLKYSLIDNFGCMLDSRRDPGASQFISRTHKTLRFSLKAFQFTADPDTDVSINCKLLVASGDPGPEHKSCTYKDNRWRALTGHDSICECCESHCGTLKPRRATVEGSASSVPLLISDQPSLTEDGFLTTDPERDAPEINLDDSEQQKSHEKLWRNADKEKQEFEESRVELGETTGPDLFDDFMLMEGGFEGWWDDYDVRDPDGFEEEGSANGEVNYSEDELESKMFQPWEELGEYEEEDDGEKSEGSDDQETTWYFTWR